MLMNHIQIGSPAHKCSLALYHAFSFFLSLLFLRIVFCFIFIVICRHMYVYYVIITLNFYPHYLGNVPFYVSEVRLCLRIVFIECELYWTFQMVWNQFHLNFNVTEKGQTAFVQNGNVWSDFVPLYSSLARRQICIVSPSTIRIYELSQMWLKLLWALGK